MENLELLQQIADTLIAIKWLLIIFPPAILGLLFSMAVRK